MHIVGLTGGTGAGKSSAARRFETHGIAVVDADKAGHALIAPGGDAVGEIIAAFGDGVLNCGKIDRDRLGALVFSDPDALARLNAIMQPRIVAAISRQCLEHSTSGAPVCMVDAALLGDSGVLEPWLEDLILVSCAEERRVARLVEHRGLTTEVAWKRVRAQVDPESKRVLARWVIENEGTLNAMNDQVDVIAQALLSSAWSRDCGTM